MTQENLVSTETIASLFKLTPRRIQQLTAEGVLKQTKDTKDRGRKKYDLVPTIQAYIEFLSQKAYGRGGNDTEEAKRKKIEIDTELRSSQVELHRLKVAIARGEYLPIEEVRLDYQRFFVTLKKAVMAVPVRMAAKLNGAIDPTQQRALEREVTREMKDILKGFVLAAVESAEAGGDKPKDGNK